MITFLTITGFSIAGFSAGVLLANFAWGREVGKIIPKNWSKKKDK